MKFTHAFIGSLIASSTLFIVPLAEAASFQSYEQSATLTGTANAGTTVTDDPSIQFYNPAGMAFVKGTQIGISSILVNTNANIDVTKATGVQGLPIKGNLDGPGTLNIVPAFYIIYPLNDKISVGLGAETPFGLETKYSDNSLARYFATESKILTINLNPSISYKVTKNFAVGIGFDALYLKANLNQAADFQGLTSGLIKHDLFIDNTASNWGYGWNAGIYYAPVPITRLGFGFHSRINLNVKGASNIHGIANPNEDFIAGFFGFQDGTVTSSLTLPEYFTVSMAQDINPHWTIMGDVEYIRWSALTNIVLNFVGDNPKKNNLPAQTLPLFYRDTWRLALGSSCKITQKLTGRLGIAWDQEPIRDQFREPRLPTDDRYWLAIGGTYDFSKMISLSAAYAHIFVKKASVNDNVTTPFGTQSFVASYTGGADLFGLQLNIRFS